MSSQPRALLLDAGFASLPFLDVLSQRGYLSAVCGSKPRDPGHQFADLSSPINYGDPDSVIALCKELNISALLPGVTDVSYLTGAVVAETLGFHGYDSPQVSDILFKKDQFRAWAIAHHFPVPAAVNQLADSATLPLPLIVKPVDAYSGLGIARIDHRDALAAAFHTAAQASRSGEALIEQYVDGSLHSHSAFIRDGCIAVEFFVDEYSTVYPWQVNSSSLSAQLGDNMKNRVSDCLASLVADLDLVDGLLHTQFMVQGEDFWLIELTRRCPGDLYSRLITLSTGTPYCDYFVQPFIGVNTALPVRRPEAQRYIARHTVSTTQSQRFRGLSLACPEARVIEVIPLKLPGEMLEAAPRDRAALVFAECDNARTLAAVTPQLKHYFHPQPVQGEMS